MWRNWAGDQSCDPARIERPASVAEVERLVAAAASDGGRIRAAGSGHSFTDIALTDATMVDLSRMGRILDADRDSGLVKVEAGINLHDLNRKLWDEHGLALRNLGDIDVQNFLGMTKDTRPGFSAIRANAWVRSPNATVEQLEELCQYVQDTSPVRDIIANAVPVDTSLEVLA